jgi:hypothetical protein
VPAQAIYEEEESEERVASSFVLGTMLETPVKERTADKAKQAGLAMRANGWQGPKPIRINGRTVRGFARPIAQPWD